MSTRPPEPSPNTRPDDAPAAPSGAAASPLGDQCFRVLFEHNPQPMWVFDRATLGILAVNDAAVEAYGYSREEFARMTIADLRSVDDQPSLHAALSPPGTGRSAPGIFRHRRRDGSHLLADVVSYGVQWEGREARLVLATDVTAREAASEAIRASEARFRELASAVREVFFVAEHSEPGVPVRVEYVSPAYREIWGRDPATVLDDPRAWLDAVHPDDREQLLVGLAQRVHGAHDVEYRVVRPDGSVRWVRDRAFSIGPGRDGTGMRVAGVAQDVTAQHETAAALRMSEERFRSVVAAMHEGIVLVEASGAMTILNPSAARILGLEADQVGESSVFDERWRVTRADGTPLPLDEFPVVATLRTGEPRHGTVIGFTRRDGGQAWVTVHTEPIRWAGADAPTAAVITFEDVTAQRAAEDDRARLEAQLRQAQKMEAIGRLAGGVAHDFNNLLTAIRGNAELAAATLPAGSEARADVEEIRHAADRAAGLTRQLLAVSRKQVMQPRVVVVDQVVEGVERLLRRVIGEDVQLLTSRETRGRCVLADPGQLEQLLLNLAVNARDAMPHGGTLTIRTAVAGADAIPPAEREGVVAPHGVVLIRVEDDGLGMDEATAARAFEPFFTTKALGKGTGLGLATVYGISRQSGGASWLASAPGKGTTVWVALPIVDVAPSRRTPVAGLDAVRARGRVLLVEDEDRVRALAARILRRAGYEVLEAGDGVEGATVWEARGGAGGGIDIVVSDVVMPRRGGPELVRALRAERPDLPVVFTSGYSEGSLAAADLGGRTAFLEKPFTVDQLLRAVGETLAAAVEPA